MKVEYRWHKHTLHFTFRAGTSRGYLTERDTYFVMIGDPRQSPSGIGECAPLRGLSQDDRTDYGAMVKRSVTRASTEPPPGRPEDIDAWIDQLIPKDLPSLRFGWETAWRDYLSGGGRCIFPTIMQEQTFSPLPINGLVWMGDREFMLRQIKEKVAQGFRCIKLKIGAIDFSTELSLLSYLRERFTPEQLTLRVDANGAFAAEDVHHKLESLSDFGIHSIEQPVAPGQPKLLSELCQNSPVPIALDEELIGVNDAEQQLELLDRLKPQYIVLKPTLLGGLRSTARWIQYAQSRSIGWWLTSALESNVGLNAIAQFASYQRASSYQGLGTGQLYSDNIPSPISIRDGHLHYDPRLSWDFSSILL